MDCYSPSTRKATAKEQTPRKAYNKQKNATACSCHI